MSALQRVIIRVDASVIMGMGHLARCISLANALAEEGTRSVFLIRSHAQRLAALIEANGHAVNLLPDPASPAAVTPWLPTTWQHDADQTLEAIGEIGSAEWLIVDHYGLDARWESIQRTRIPRILAIDDIADRPHDCDLLLDQNLVAELDTRYQGLVPATCRFLLGPGFALLRAEFAECRRRLGVRRGDVRRVLVCFGGSDPSNETAKALVAIKALPVASVSVDVVIGVSNPHIEAVSAICRTLPQATLHCGADNMAELMLQADLAIGAGGTMNWERCCLGLPTLAMDIADNQVAALTALARAGALDYLGSANSVDSGQIARALDAFTLNPSRMRAMGAAALALVDGEGSSRVCRALGSAFP
ncbi:UDP-2,4-diacetamido-2,4,6-trideoxy-beta-L-altropyranose hydrolase [Bradyrhizobium lablabi]|uniref:UDP-2,4-diacetamido-2,4, 6-trideoxy-beta-L-altropyranose hydrolase n=1 Tax=Bradyrhizobium lablabi TaxID=722472 RepID=UPI001BA9BF79|nr:UDP-2,4-diacetamido-2,4,6-trideoxy-beta-L-altropyranose hydrolase [Bradyrhizobium lablabi]MBR0694882.1 UDP-2,4-diacetamido-2,4,6-trideoxy-beta-L-altropyranose hydrolase [Bradyrhizobium lablabi]